MIGLGIGQSPIDQLVNKLIYRRADQWAANFFADAQLSSASLWLIRLADQFMGNQFVTDQLGWPVCG